MKQNNSRKNILELVMIVKDAESTIRDTLKAIFPFIDYWTILDTGSTDNTIKIIESEMKGKDGHLYQEQFIDFSTSRNRALELARQRTSKLCKYTIMLDDSYIMCHGKELIKLLKNTKGDAFHIAIRDNLNRVYYSCRIFKTSLNLKYKYKVHEVLNYKGTGLIINCFDTNIFLYDNRQDTERTNTRLPQDIIWLKEDIDRYPNDPRPIYFLANTYYTMKDYSNAKQYYIRRLEMKGMKGSLRDELYQSNYILGVIFEEEKDVDTSLKYYLQAHKLDHRRAEPLYRLGAYYFRIKDYDTANTYLYDAYKLTIPNVLLPIEYDVYTTKIPFLYADLCLKTKREKEGRKVIDKALKCPQPPAMVTQFQNMLSSVSKETVNVTKTSDPVVVFHTEDKVDPDKIVSDREYILVGLAEALVCRNWKVIIFCTIKDGFSEKNIKGVIYKSRSEFKEYIQKYFIDALVVSQYAGNLTYLPNIERVYLWLHESIPTGQSFQTHSDKFKGVLCLSKWHQDRFGREFQFPLELIHITRYAINPLEFPSVIQKGNIQSMTVGNILLRFICIPKTKTSVKLALKLFPTIRTKYPNAELDIYTDYKIKPNLGSIHIHSNFDQRQLMFAFAQSDVWLNLDETEPYCLYALYAQMTRTLCVSISPLESIGKRGVIADETSLITKLSLVLDQQELRQLLLDKGEEWAKLQTFDVLAEEWEDDFLL